MEKMKGETRKGAKDADFCNQRLEEGPSPLSRYSNHPITGAVNWAWEGEGGKNNQILILTFLGRREWVTQSWNAIKKKGEPRKKPREALGKNMKEEAQNKGP